MASYCWLLAAPRRPVLQGSGSSVMTGYPLPRALFVPRPPLVLHLLSWDGSSVSPYLFTLSTSAPPFIILGFNVFSGPWNATHWYHAQSGPTPARSSSSSSSRPSAVTTSGSAPSGRSPILPPTTLAPFPPSRPPRLAYTALRRRRKPVPWPLSTDTRRRMRSRLKQQTPPCRRCRPSPQGTARRP